MKYCPYCGAGLYEDVKFCPVCGKKYSGTQGHNKKNVIWGCVAIVCACVAIVMLMNTVILPELEFSKKTSKSDVSNLSADYISSQVEVSEPAIEETTSETFETDMAIEQESVTQSESNQVPAYMEGTVNTGSVFKRTCYRESNRCEIVTQGQMIYFCDLGCVYAMPSGGAVQDAELLFRTSDLYDLLGMDSWPNSWQNYAVRDFQIIGDILYFEIYHSSKNDYSWARLCGFDLKKYDEGEISVEDLFDFQYNPYGDVDYIINTNEEGNLTIYWLSYEKTQTSASTYSCEAGFEGENGVCFSVELTESEYKNYPLTIVAYTDSSALLKYGSDKTFVLYDFDTQSYTINPGNFAEYPSRPVYVNGEDYYVDDVGTLYRLSPENNYCKEEVFSVIPNDKRGASSTCNLGYIFLEDGRIITTFTEEAPRDMAIYLWDGYSFTTVSPDYVRNMKYVGDGYIYYKYASTDLDAGELHRVKIDGTGWENLSEALEH